MKFLVTLFALLALSHTNAIKATVAIKTAITVVKKAADIIKYVKDKNDLAHAKFSVAAKVVFGPYPTTPKHAVNLAPVIHVRNSQGKTKVSTYHGIFPVGEMYYATLDNLKSQITQMEFDFPNGSPTSVAAICFSFGPNAVISYQEPVCLPMAITPHCKEYYPDSEHIFSKHANVSTINEWVDFCDQKDCTRSLLIEDVAEFVYALTAWTKNASSLERLCRSIAFTKPTFTVPEGKFTCYSFNAAIQNERVSLANIPASADYKMPWFPAETCSIDQHHHTAWSDADQT